MKTKTYSVSVIIITPDGIVFVKEKKSEGKKPRMWKLPGGGQQSTDPTFRSAAIREVREETGINLSTSPLQIKTVVSKNRYHSHIFFLAHLKNNPITEDNRNEINTVEIFSLNVIENGNQFVSQEDFLPGHRDIILNLI